MLRTIVGRSAHRIVAANSSASTLNDRLSDRTERSHCVIGRVAAKPSTSAPASSCAQRAAHQPGDDDRERAPRHDRDDRLDHHERRTVTGRLPQQRDHRRPVARPHPVAEQRLVAERLVLERVLPDQRITGAGLPDPEPREHADSGDRGQHGGHGHDPGPPGSSRHRLQHRRGSSGRAPGGIDPRRGSDSPGTPVDSVLPWDSSTRSCTPARARSSSRWSRSRRSSARSRPRCRPAPTTSSAPSPPSGGSSSTTPATPTSSRSTSTTSSPRRSPRCARPACARSASATSTSRSWAARRCTSAGSRR